MATTSIIAPTSKFSYFKFKTKGSENGGYSNTFKDNKSMYIGQSTTSGNNAGTNCGSFGIMLYDVPDKDKMSSITSIDFSIFTTKSSSGYNDCMARIEYIGTSYNAYPGIWRVGSSSEQISLEENKTTHLTTSNSTTCSNFLNLIKSATSGQYYFFRIIRESGQGAVLKKNITLTINYQEGPQTYVNVNGVWKTATPYVNVNGTWKQANPSVQVSGSWK